MAQLAQSSRTFSSRASRPAAVSRRPAVQVKALFSGLKNKVSKAPQLAYVCVDCGYLYDGKQGAFEELPGSYSCPVCGANKNRFRVYEGNRSKSNDNKSMTARRDGVRAELEEKGESVDSDPTFLIGTAAVTAVFLGAVYYFTVLAR